MRLTKSELAAIKAVFFRAFKGRRASLYLFGSRTVDSQRGGDIDLLVVGDQELLDRLKLSQHLLLDELYAQIGEQRIDLTFATPEKMITDEFLTSIQSTVIELR